PTRSVSPAPSTAEAHAIGGFDHILDDFRRQHSYPWGQPVANPPRVHKKLTPIAAISLKRSPAIGPVARLIRDQERVGRSMDVRILLTAGLVLAGTGAAAAAQTGAASTIGSFKQWTAYTSSESDGKMCFIAAQPTDSKYV